MKIEIAKNKWCPFSLNAPAEAVIKCMCERCMAWESTEWEGEKPTDGICRLIEEDG